MKKITSIILIILLTYSQIAYAAPYKCDLGFISADSNQCNSLCKEESGGKLACREMNPSSDSSGVCDTGKYKGFVAVNGKTFAITKQSVAWSGEQTAIVRDSVDNRVIANMLKVHGIGKAWIGAYDPSQSDEYENIVPSRFVWRNGSKVSYSNWRNGEPNNHADPSSVGKAPIYGEHWTAISSDGYWQDLGYNTDGTERLLPAVIEFNGILSCVSGQEKEPDSAGSVSGIVCAGSQDASGMVQLKPCETGLIFGTANTGYLCSEGKTACIEGKKEIVTEKSESFEGVIGYEGYCSEFDSSVEVYTPYKPKRKVSISKDNKTIQIETLKGYGDTGNEGGFQWVEGNTWHISESYTFDRPIKSFKYEGKKFLNHSIITSGCGGDAGYCPDYMDLWQNKKDTFLITDKVGEVFSDPHINPPQCLGNTNFYKTTLTVTYETINYEPTYTCPYSGRPCIENKGQYYCSPNDCLNGSDGSSYEKDDSVEGDNDADNNGNVDENGECKDKLVIFPGNDKRCRPVGSQTAGKNCCRIADIKESEKPDITISQLEMAAILWATGMPWLILFAQMAEFNVCTGSERQMWVSRGFDQCVYVGRYCSEKWAIGGCVQSKETYCCFESDFNRAFNEAGMDLLGKSWGTAKSPQCGGFSPEEMQALNVLGISEHPKMRAFADKLGEEFSDKLMNEFNNTFDAGKMEEQLLQQVEGLRK